jgi:hypothetical protein
VTFIQRNGDVYDYPTKSKEQKIEQEIKNVDIDFFWTSKKLSVYSRNPS